MVSSVVAIGAHPCDIELGCAATLWRHKRDGLSIVMVILSNGTIGPGKYRRRRKEAKAAASRLGAELKWVGSPDGTIPESSKAVQALEELLTEIDPLIVYTHAENDSNPDHRAAAALVQAAAANCSTILHFQSPTSKNFSPTVFIGIDSEDLATKLAALELHVSPLAETDRVEPDVVASAARYWGTACHVDFAEAFEVTRVLLGKQTDGGEASVP
jgi:LmbE family N-acetylglucosaminyl deacetylase